MRSGGRGFLICVISAGIAVAPLSATTAQSAEPSVAELRFSEMFRAPVGPRGLEPSARFLALDGQSVRMAGYMAQRETPLAGTFVLAPLPVLIHDEDEGLADDLPASSIVVKLAPREDGGVVTLANLRGLIRLTGTLRVGNRDEADGRVSAAQLEIDVRQTRALEQLANPERPAP